MKTPSVWFHCAFILWILLSSLLLSTGAVGSDTSGEPLEPVFIIGYSASVFADVDMKDARVVTRIWSDMIAKKRGNRASTVIYDNLLDFEKDVDARKIDLAVLASNELFGIKEVNKTSQAVLPVFFRQADVCVVSRGAFETMKELNPQLGQELTAIALSDGYVRGVVCMRPDFRREDEGLVNEILSLHVEPQGKQILTLIKVNRLIPFEPSYLETVEALLKDHRALRLKLARER